MTTRSYKANFILDTRNVEGPTDAIIDGLKEIITSIGGSITNVQNNGTIPFVRVTDRKAPQGQYVQIDFSAAPAAPSALKEKLKLDKKVKRIFIESL